MHSPAATPAAHPLSRRGRRCAVSRPATAAAAPSPRSKARSSQASPLVGLGQDHRHRLGVDGATSAFGAVVRKPKRSAVTGALLDLPHRGPVRPDAGEEGERPALVEGEPDRRPRAVRRGLVLGKAGEGHEAAVLGPEPAPPVRRGDLRMLVTPRIDLLAGEVLGGVGMPQRAMTSSRPFGGVADDRRGVVRVDARQRRHVSEPVDQPIEEPADPGTGRADLLQQMAELVEEAHAPRLDRQHAQEARARGDAVLTDDLGHASEPKQLLAGLTRLVLPEPEPPSATERMLVRRFEGVAKARPITAPSTGSATASAPASVDVAEAASMYSATSPSAPGQSSGPSGNGCAARAEPAPRRQRRRGAQAAIPLPAGRAAESRRHAPARQIDRSAGCGMPLPILSSIRGRRRSVCAPRPRRWRPDRSRHAVSESRNGSSQSTARVEAASPGGDHQVDRGVGLAIAEVADAARRGMQVGAALLERPAARGRPPRRHRLPRPGSPAGVS